MNIYKGSQLHLVVKLKGKNAWVNYSIFMILCILFGWIIMELSALIISALRMNEDCNDNKLNGYSTQPSTVLITGSFITVLYMIYRIMVIMCFIGLKNNAITQCVDRVFYVFIFSWSIVGFVVYESMNTNCRNKDIGEILVGWSILHFIFSICCGAFTFYME